jgi:GTP-binding protein HflX
MPDGDTASLARRLVEHPMRSVGISAMTGQGIDELLAAVDEVLPLDPVGKATIRLSAGDGATLAMLHEFGRVLETRYGDGWVEVEAEVPESLRRIIHRTVEKFEEKK